MLILPPFAAFVSESLNNCLVRWSLKKVDFSICRIFIIALPFSIKSILINILCLFRLGVYIIRTTILRYDFIPIPSITYLLFT